MVVRWIVKTIAPWCLGRPDALLPEAECIGPCEAPLGYSFDYSPNIHEITVEYFWGFLHAQKTIHHLMSRKQGQCENKCLGIDAKIPALPSDLSCNKQKTILQRTVIGARRRGRQKKRWEDNIEESSLEIPWGQWKTGEGIVATSSMVSRQPARLRDWDEIPLKNVIVHINMC